MASRCIRPLAAAGALLLRQAPPLTAPPRNGLLSSTVRGALQPVALSDTVRAAAPALAAPLRSFSIIPGATLSRVRLRPPPLPAMAAPGSLAAGDVDGLRRRWASGGAPASDSTHAAQQESTASTAATTVVTATSARAAAPRPPPSTTMAGDAARLARPPETAPQPQVPPPPPPPPPMDHNPHRVWTVPNALTGLRMALSPVVAYQIVVGAYPAAAATLAFSAFLDWADGWVARTWDQGSLLGSFLDPLSDKALVACTGAALGWVGVLPLPLLALVIGRDVALVGGAFYFRAVTRRPGEAFFALSSVDWKVEPSTLSKANTVLQLVTVLAGVGHAGWGVPPAELLTGLCWATAGTTFASGWGYWRNAGVTVRAAAAAVSAAGGAPAPTGAASPASHVAEFRQHAKDVQSALFGRLLGRAPAPSQPGGGGGGGAVTSLPLSSAAAAAAPVQGGAGKPAPVAPRGQPSPAPAAPGDTR